MKQKTAALIFSVVILFQMFLLVPITVAEAIDPAKLSEECADTNVNLQEKFFKDKVEGGLQGHGVDEGSTFGGNKIYGAENSIATAAFYDRYYRSGNAECDSWATDELLEKGLKGIKAKDKIKREGSDYYFTVDQGMALEFVSEGYELSQNQIIFEILESVFTSLSDFEANTTVEYYGYENAYWAAIDDNGFKSEEPGYEYCHTNASLWAIIGMLHFGSTVKGLTIDEEEEYSKTSVEMSEKTIEFCEKRCFFNGSGFLEFPKAHLLTPERRNYYFNTQVLALLAYARLYEATGRQTYLDKANSMIEYIITKNFLSGGKTGGCYSYISLNNGETSDTKIGYDNALYVYALMTMYALTGEQDIAYLRRAEEIVSFMNSELLKESKDGELIGYAEVLTNNSVSDADEFKYYWTTNALMMFANEEVQFYERPWYIKYLWWLIIGGVVIVAVVFIAVLIRRKRNIGRKLPKLVKGLVED